MNRLLSGAAVLVLASSSCALIDGLTPPIDVVAEGEGDGDGGAEGDGAEGEGEGGGEGEGEPGGCFDDVDACVPCAAALTTPSVLPDVVRALRFASATGTLFAVTEGTSGLVLRERLATRTGLVDVADVPLDLDSGARTAGLQLLYSDANHAVRMVLAPDGDEGQFRTLSVDPGSGTVLENDGSYSYLGATPVFFADDDDSGLTHVVWEDDGATLADRTIRIDGFERRCPAALFSGGALESEIVHTLHGMAVVDTGGDAAHALVTCGRSGFDAHVLALTHESGVTVVADLSGVDDVAAAAVGLGDAIYVALNALSGGALEHRLYVVRGSEVTGPTSLAPTDQGATDAGGVRLTADAGGVAAVLFGAGAGGTVLLLGDGSTTAVSDATLATFTGTHVVDAALAGGGATSAEELRLLCP